MPLSEHANSNSPSSGPGPGDIGFSGPSDFVRFGESEELTRAKSAEQLWLELRAEPDTHPSDGGRRLHGASEGQRQARQRRAQLAVSEILPPGNDAATGTPAAAASPAVEAAAAPAPAAAPAAKGKTRRGSMNTRCALRGSALPRPPAPCLTFSLTRARRAQQRRAVRCATAGGDEEAAGGERLAIAILTQRPTYPLKRGGMCRAGRSKTCGGITHARRRVFVVTKGYLRGGAHSPARRSKPSDSGAKGWVHPRSGRVLW